MPSRPLAPHRQTNTATRDALAVCLLALVLLFNQSLGMVHAVLHGPVAAQGAEAREGAGERRDGLFASHHSVADCHAFDALSHADALPAVPLACLAAATQALLDLQPPSGRIAPQAAGFLARGPPPSFLG